MHKNTAPIHHLNLCKTVLCTLFCFTLIFSFISCSNLNLPKKPSETGSFSFILSDDILAHLEDAIGSSGSTAIARSVVTPLITATVSLDKTSGGQLVNPVSISGTLTSFRNKELTIEDIPVREAFIVTITFTANGLDILTGKSSPVTLTSTEPANISISLQYASGNTQFYSGMITGTWAFDYGYNQEQWLDELITFKEDGSFELHIISSEYKEWDTGTWSLSTDAQGRQVLALHITAYSNDNSTWNNVDNTFYYYIDVLDDELVMNRFQRDRVEEDGWHPVEYYEPAIYNHYYRVKNGNREQLENATWNAVNSNDYWEEHSCTWAFNTDGTMVNTYDLEPSDAIWEIIQEDGRTLLYVKVTWNPDYQEWWYEYTSLGPDLIHVKAVKHTTNGIEDENDADSYYYRDIPLVKYTYHWKVSDETTYTFYDYWPKGREYTTFDSSKVNYIAGVPDQYLEQQILGIYTSEAMTGDPVKKISAAANTADREFWVKWGLKTHHNGTETEFCHSTSIPASDVFPNLTFSANDTIAIHFEADLSKDIDGWTQIKIWPESGGDPIAFSEVEVHTTGRHLSETYLLKTTAASVQSRFFEYVYNQETGPVVFSNYTLTVLDDTNSYKINYHIGNRTHTERVPVEEDSKVLSRDPEYYIQNIIPKGRSDFTFHCSEMVGWYTDATLTESVSSIGQQAAGSTKDVYLKFNPKISRWDDPESTEGWHNYSATLPAQVLGFDDFAPEAGETVYLYVEATLSKDLHGNTCIELADGAHDFWWICRSEEKCVYTQDGKLAELYTIHISDDENYFKEHLPNHPDESDLCIDFVYHPDALDEVVGITNYKVTLVSSSQLYTINYHFGNMMYTEKAYRLADRKLPTDMMYFEHYNSEIAHNLELVGWCSDSSLSSSISQFAKGTVTPGTSKDVFLNYKLRLHRYAPENGNISNYFPAAMFLTGEQISSIVSGNSPAFTLSADLTEFAANSACNLTIVDTRYDEWTPLASKKNIHPGDIFQFASTNQVADPPSIENLAIDINIGEYPREKGDDCIVSGFNLTGTN